MNEITAVEMAKDVGIDPKKFRHALRSRNFDWHNHNDRWTVTKDSAEYDQMKHVLAELT